MSQAPTMGAPAQSAKNSRFTQGERNLGYLQEILRKDPESYKDEFMEQFVHYTQTMHLLHLQPAQHRLDLGPLLDLVTFLSGVASNYPVQAKEFAESLMTILREQAAGLDPVVRMSFCKALVVLRNRGVVKSLDLLQLFFELIKVEDKHLRKFILGAVASLIKKMVTQRKDARELGKIQNLVFAKLKDSRSIVARASQLVLIDAFRKRLWRDSKTANVIAECCFHKLPKIQVTAMKFFLGSKNDEEGIEADSDDEEEDGKKDDQKTIKEVMVAFRVGKKTKKRQKQFEKAKKSISKEKKSKKDGRSKECNLLAIQSLFDPQEFADRLFGMLEQKKVEKFEVRLFRIALCARVIGVHRVQSLGFYSFLHRFLTPKQRDVTRILLYAAQACHSLVPPDTVEQLIRVVANNFITDRNSPEAITVGINAIREILANCPFAATEELIRDLAEYKGYKNKNVSMAARSLVGLVRTLNPKLLQRRDRGRPTELEQKEDFVAFGAPVVASAIEGAECLEEDREEAEGMELDDEEESDGDGWEDVSDEEIEGVSDGEEEDGEEKAEEDEDEQDDDEDDSDEEMEDEDDDEEEDDEEEDEDVEEGVSEKKKTKKSKSEKKAEKEASKEELKAKAEHISAARILTQEEFRRIQSFQLKKKLMGEKKARSNVKVGNAEIKIGEELEEKLQRREEGDGLPRLNDIEHFHKKKKETKEERMARVEEGREGREEFGKPKKRGPHVGRTNRELAKRKAFSMVKAKVRGKNRQRSLRDQQMSLRKYLLRQQGKKA